MLKCAIKTCARLRLRGRETGQLKIQAMLGIGLDLPRSRGYQRRQANSEGHRIDSVSVWSWQNRYFANDGKLEKRLDCIKKYSAQSGKV